ncbi:MAG: ecdysteroid 22-kinase family protein [Desulfobacterales bacterium]|nr:ecdysteroid 22-kinase family protein [Desulfobacterales bacterium]
MTAAKFPTCIEELSCEWFTEILHKSGIPNDVIVKNFSVSPVSDPGQTSDVVRINLEYDEENPNSPTSLIGKFPAEFDQARQMAQAMNTYLKEVNFFKYVADSAKGLAPRCFAAEIDLETHDFVLMLEDIAHLRPGEMYVTKPEDSRLMLAQIAPFHARWWNHPDLDKLDWIPQPEKPTFKPWMEQLKQVFAAILPMVKQQFESYMSANAWATLEKSLVVWDEMFDFAPGPYTLCHGDYHYQQCFFPSASDNRFSVIDWQVLCVNAAAMDVARPLLIDPESRRAHEKDIVDSYYEILVQNGVKNYSLDDLWEDIRLNAFWTSYIYILAIVQTDNEIFKTYAAERGQDPYEALLTWPGSGLDDWEVSKAIDRYLERARAAKSS